MNARLATLVGLLHGVSHAALATQSVRLPGFPFARAVAFAPDEGHCPIMLMSRLAEHSRNLEQDRRASLMVARSLGNGEIERATLVGEIVPHRNAPDAVERYLRYQPDAKRLLALGDFGFVRLDVQRMQVIGGFAQAGWLDASALTGLPHFAAEIEERLREQLAPVLPADWTLLGIDALGADLAVSDRRERIEFGTGPVAPAAVPDAFSEALKRRLAAPDSIVVGRGG